MDENMTRNKVYLLFKLNAQNKSSVFKGKLCPPTENFVPRKKKKTIHIHLQRVKIVVILLCKAYALIS